MNDRRVSAILTLAALVAAGLPPSARPGDIAGVTRPFHEAVISASVPGTVRKIWVREGDAVETDQPLIELDRAQEELEVARRKLVWENQAEARAAAARVAAAKADLEATRKVFESTRSVSREELDKKQLDYDLAVAENDKVGMTEQREKIEFDMAVEALNRRTVRSPMKAVVTARRVQEGEGCEIHQPLIVLVDVSQCYFVANVEAPVLASFKPGQEVSILVDASPGRIQVRGRISYLAPVVDAASGLGELKALFPNADGRIRPGVSASLVRPDGGAGGTTR